MQQARRFTVLAIAAVVTGSFLSAAQTPAAQSSPAQPGATPLPAAAAPTRVMANSKVFIEPAENGMHTALAGAITKKKVPLIMVISAEKADYIISVVGEYKKAGWAKTIMSSGASRGEANASMTVAHRESGQVMFAYNVDKGNAARGLQSAAEPCAKHLGNHIKGKE